MTNLKGARVVVVTAEGDPVSVGLTIGDRVIIDDDVPARITGILIGYSGVQFECSWFSNGAPQHAWFPEWRITNDA
jgi:hypothetical protein